MYCKLLICAALVIAGCSVPVSPKLDPGAGVRDAGAFDASDPYERPDADSGQAAADGGAGSGGRDSADGGVVPVSPDDAAVMPLPEALLTPVRETIRVGELASFKAEASQFDEKFYGGRLGGVDVSFAVRDSMTVSVIVPEHAALGNVEVVLELPSLRLRGQVEVQAGVPIADPDAVVMGVLDAPIGDPSQSGELSDELMGDIQYEAQLRNAARAAYDQLDAQDRLEVARILQSLAVGVDASQIMTLSPTADDVACASKLTGLSGEQAAAERATATALSWRSNPLKWVVAQWVVVKTYLAVVLAYGGVGVVCNLEKNFQADQMVSPDLTATIARIDAARYTFSREDAENNALAKTYFEIADGMGALHETITSLFEGERAPNPPQDPENRFVAKVDVDPSRITLETTTVADADGKQVALKLLRDGLDVVIQAGSELRRTIRRSLGFKVSRPGFADRVFVTEVEIRSVCMEAGQIFPGCVDNIKLEPVNLYLALNASMRVKAVAYSFDGEILARTFRWSSSADSIVHVIASSEGDGIVAAVGERQEPVVITASSGEGSSERHGTANVYVTEPDETAKYAAAVLGSWTVTNAEDGTSYNLELFEGGRGTYHVGADYGVTWGISRTGYKQYILYETGFWHPGFNGGTSDPLTIPATSFKNYSPWAEPFTVVSRIYSKN